jgi:hypothetical protein
MVNCELVRIERVAMVLLAARDQATGGSLHKGYLGYLSIGYN